MPLHQPQFLAVDALSRPARRVLHRGEDARVHPQPHDHHGDGDKTPPGQHTPLQIARIISGIAPNRVQTLHGLAWRFHASSVMRNALAILDTAPMTVVLTATRFSA